MNAILTKTLAPTNTQGTRIRAYDCEGNTITVPYDYCSSDKDAHKAAVKALCNKMRWHGELIGGAIAGGYAFTFVSMMRMIDKETA